MTVKEYLELYHKYPNSKKYEGWEEDFNKIVEYNKALCKEYPFLLPRNRWSGKPITTTEEGYWPGSPDDIPDYDWSYTELDDMPDGWRIAFGDQMMKELKEELLKFNYLDKFVITQIKEKYGSLRFYAGSYPVGKLSEVIETIIKDEWKYPEHEVDELVTYTGKNDKGQYIYEKQKILDECKISIIISKYERLSEKICISCGNPATWVSRSWISPWCDKCAEFDNEYESYTPIKDYYGEDEKELEN